MVEGLLQEGCIKIHLQQMADSGAVNTVHIQSQRPLHNERLFVGKSVDETLQLLPAVFHVCAHAHSCASVCAIEKAAGYAGNPEVEAVRDSLLRLETIGSHLWRILLDWPQAMGLPPNHALLARFNQLVRDYKNQLCLGHDYFQFGPRSYLKEVDENALRKSAFDIDSFISEEIFGWSSTDWLQMLGLTSFNNWLAESETIAATYVKHIAGRGWQGAGSCQIEALPNLAISAENALHQAMQNPDFIEQPLWQGNCCETNSSVRVQSPLLLHMRKQHGHGLFTRVLARLTEVVMLDHNLIPKPSAPGGLVSLLMAQTTAIGRVQAARGQLYHRVEVKDSKIASYQILAPTEWNFHPAGVVAQGLANLKGTRDEVTAQAHAFIEALDPCVQYQLTVNAPDNIHA